MQGPANTAGAGCPVGLSTCVRHGSPPAVARAVAAGGASGLARLRVRLEAAERGLTTVEHNAERIFEAELLRLKAKALLVDSGPNAETEAHALLERATATARSQEARSLELRAATDLAELLARQASSAEALAVLEPVYGWFEEGLATSDLVQANALIRRLR